MTIQSFWVRKYPVQTYPATFSLQIHVFWIQFWAPTQAQPGRASPSPGPAGPRSGQDLPGRDFPDLRFLAEVGNCPRQSCGGRESAPGGRESTIWGAGRANPSRAGIFPTSANSQRSGKSLPSINLPDLPMALLSQGTKTYPQFKDISPGYLFWKQAQVQRHIQLFRLFISLLKK